MKKILAFCFLFLFIFQTSFAYSPTAKDEKTLRGVYSKIDVIYNKKPSTIEKLYQQIISVKEKYKPNQRAYYLL